MCSIVCKISSISRDKSILGRLSRDKSRDKTPDRLCIPIASLQDHALRKTYRMAGLPTLPGVVVPLVLPGLRPDARLKTPLDPVAWADFALAALAIISEIMPLLRVSGGYDNDDGNMNLKKKNVLCS